MAANKLCDPGQPIFPLWTSGPSSGHFVTRNSGTLSIYKRWHFVFGFVPVGAKQTHQRGLSKSLLWKVKVQESTTELDMHIADENSD